MKKISVSSNECPDWLEGWMNNTMDGLHRLAGEVAALKFSLHVAMKACPDHDELHRAWHAAKLDAVDSKMELLSAGEDEAFREGYLDAIADHENAVNNLWRVD